MLRQIIITRPVEEAVDWVHRLQAAGWPAVALPLIRLGEPRSLAARAAVQHHRMHWTDWDALMFVSGAAVRYFFGGDTSLPIVSNNQTRFWAPGPGTARALQEPLVTLGLLPDRIDTPPADAEQFDSEALWPVVAPQLHAGARILIVRGASVSDAAETGGGRDWLIRQCQQVGASVCTVAAYERHPPVWGAEEDALARHGQAAGSVWLFSSSQALDHLLAQQPQADWSCATALVTHPRIAARVTGAGFGEVVQIRPSFDEVIRILKFGWSPL